VGRSGSCASEGFWVDKAVEDVRWESNETAGLIESRRRLQIADVLSTDKSVSSRAEVTFSET